MRIGEFAKKFGTTIDTIRHYMDIQLLLPDKLNGQYEFDEKCCADMDNILWFKKTGFTLPEIQKLFTVRRLTNLRDEGNKQFYITTLTNKKSSFLDEINNLKKNITEIECKINSLQKDTTQPIHRLGVPIEFIPLLSCPKCSSSMILLNGSIEDNMIMNGALSCSCGYRLYIADGIITRTPEVIPARDEYKPNDFNTREEYFKKTSPKFINLMHKSRAWIVTKLKSVFLPWMVIMEAGTGWGMLLKDTAGCLDRNNLYIATDNNIVPLAITKWELEKDPSPGKYVFIHGDIEEIPLKGESVDIILDFWGTSCHNFERTGYLVEHLRDKLKYKGRWIAGHLHFKRNAISLLRLNEECRPFFYIENIIKSFEERGFEMIESKDMGGFDEAGEYEPFLVQGDKAFEWVCYGEKVR